ncbi:MAG: hypothetical protein FWC15_01470 [Fibromonadales bacterium]|nr:hypothetical protein [Fibromonadales bacterium]
MNKIFIFCLLAASIAMAQRQKIAVLPALMDNESMLTERQLEMLTDKVRSIASDNLPLSDFILLKQDFVIEQLGAEAFFNDCKEGACIGTLVAKVQADFGARCDVFVSDNKLWLKFELYGTLRGESEAGTISTFAEEVKDVPSMLDLIERRVPDAFKRIIIVPIAQQVPQLQQQTPSPAKMRFGARVNIGTAWTDAVTLKTNDEDVNLSRKFGDNKGLGVYALIPILGIYFVPELTIQHETLKREANNEDIFEEVIYKETAIDIPIFFRFRYREENLIYLGAGPYFCIVLNTAGNLEEYFKISRFRFNYYGFGYEMGIRISKHFSLDMRGFYAFGLFDNVDFSMKTQEQFGFSYTF